MATAKTAQANTPADTPATTLDPRIARIEKALERAALVQAPAWRPTEGEALSGEILGFREGSTVEYGTYPVIVIAGGKVGAPVAFHAFHQMVRETLRELKPKKGDVITIVYGGVCIVNGDEEKEEKDQKRYHLYYIESDNAEVAPVLDSIEF